MKRSPRPWCALGLLLATAPSPRLVLAADRPIVIHVAPDGVDRPLSAWGRSAGEIGPVGTLGHALALVQEIRKTPAARDSIRIELAPGTYRLDRPVAIGPDQGGSAQGPLLIQGSVSESSRIVGSRPLEPAASLAPNAASDGPLKRLPAAAGEHVRRYSLRGILAPSASIDTARPQDTVPAVPFEIFDDQGALRPARWPNSGWAHIASAIDAPTPSFKIDDVRLRGWREETDLWAGAYWQYDWRYETHRIARIDAASSSLTLDARPFEGIKAGQRVFVYHALSELDEPGEWYRDRTSNELIVWPRPGADPVLEASVTESAFVLSGASHIRFRRLTIEMFRGDAIVARKGDDIILEHCAIRWTGGRAGVFEDMTGSGIVRSHIHDTGAGGVLLYGGDRETLSPAQLFALDNRIERFARLSRTYAAAVELGGVGQTVTGNAISDADHLGILFQGNDHTIERNELFRLMQDSADGGAIYTGRDWTARGTRIRHNFIHDVVPGAGFETKGIYLDDLASGIHIEGNVFLRVQQAVFIGGGRDNRVEGNIFIATEPAVHIDSRGIDDHNAHVTNEASEIRTRLRAVPYNSPRWRSAYPELAEILEDAPGTAKRNRVAGNIVLTARPYDILDDVDRSQQTLGPNRGLESVGADVAAKAARASTAVEVGEIVRRAIQRSGVNEWPFAHLDRAAELAKRGIGTAPAGTSARDKAP